MAGVSFDPTTTNTPGLIVPFHRPTAYKSTDEINRKVQRRCVFNPFM